MSKLQMADKPEFVSKFVELQKITTPEELAVAVWDLANERYSQGFDRGYNDPEFFNDDSED